MPPIAFVQDLANNDLAMKPQTPTIRPSTTSQPPTTRSRVTNGKELVAGADGRSPQARRYRDLIAEMTNDLGGAEVLSEAQRQLIRRAAGLSVQAEAVEAAILNGKDIDLAAYVTATNALRRVLDTLGLKRVAKEVPNLQAYLAGRAAAEAAQ